MGGGKRQLEVTPDVHSTAESAASLPSGTGAPVLSRLLNGSCYERVLCLGMAIGDWNEKNKCCL